MIIKRQQQQQVVVKGGVFAATFFINHFSKPIKTHYNLSKPLLSFMSSSSSTCCCYNSTNGGGISSSSIGGFLYNNNNIRRRSSSSSSLFWPKAFSFDPNGFSLRNSYDSHHDNNNQNRYPIVFAPHQKHHNDDKQQQQLQLFGDVGNGNLKLANGHGCSPLGFSDHQKVVVAVDVDEVLGNFISALNRFIADRYSHNHSVSEYHVYEFFRIWNCTRDEADIRVHEFFKSPYFKKGIHPIPGAREALHQLSRFCNLSVVTSRQNAIKDHTIQWIENHYPGLFKEIHFGNHFALDGESKPKSEICRSLGAKVLIDDNPRYALECAEIGIRVLLFDYENSYPWCKTDSVDQHPLVTKVHNWGEVEKHLESWIIS